MHQGEWFSDTYCWLKGTRHQKVIVYDFIYTKCKNSYTNQLTLEIRIAVTFGEKEENSNWGDPQRGPGNLLLPELVLIIWLCLLHKTSLAWCRLYVESNNKSWTHEAESSMAVAWAWGLGSGGCWSRGTKF